MLCVDSSSSRDRDEASHVLGVGFAKLLSPGDGSTEPSEASAGVEMTLPPSVGVLRDPRRVESSGVYGESSVSPRVPPVSFRGVKISVSTNSENAVTMQ